MNLKHVALAFGAWAILLTISPQPVRIALAGWMLPRDTVHVFNAEIRENADGTATILGAAKK
ncbi:hypothetical protein [Comamonas antarctica]|uniref:hypothetical protein n=1 Tax=Comamonas antarctica TaxID=2743470 RepID=UPI0028EB941B|nr:hypothetical protein [Comamonas antarctica]